MEPSGFVCGGNRINKGGCAKLCGLLFTVLVLRRDTITMATHKRKHLIECLLKISET